MSSFDYQYSLEFQTEYDVSVIDNSSVPDKDTQDFKDTVQAKIGQLKFILTLQPAVPQIASFVDFNGSRYQLVFIR